MTTNHDRKTTNEMQGFLLNPPALGARYLAIKAELIGKYRKSQLQKDNEMLAMARMGNLTASDFWSRVLALNKDPETFRRAWFLNLLPASTHALLGGKATRPR